MPSAKTTAAISTITRAGDHHGGRAARGPIGPPTPPLRAPPTGSSRVGWTWSSARLLTRRSRPGHRWGGRADHQTARVHEENTRAAGVLAATVGLGVGVGVWQ